MKTMYQCEKCGKMFENYDDARACENAHLTPDDVVLPDACNDAYQMTYADGGELPDFVTVRFPIPDDNGWGYKQDENGEYLYRYEKYVRSKHSINASQQWDIDIHKGIKEKKEAEQKWWDDYQERKAKAEAEAEAQNNEEE